jgi:hypothetical protein
MHYVVRYPTPLVNPKNGREYRVISTGNLSHVLNEVSKGAVLEGFAEDLEGMAQLMKEVHLKCN